jgi:hypothetical protein
MQEIEHMLMRDFTIESMTGNTIDVQKMPVYSEDFNLRMMQEQYAHWCVATKKLFMSDMVEPHSMQGRFSGMMKSYIVNYANDAGNRTNQAMKYLYDESNIGILVQQISMLAKYSHYKDADDFHNIPQELQSKSLDPENVSVSIALYVIFTILVNSSVTVNQYNELFIQVWFNYYENWMARELMFKMRGNATKQDFAGVLLS